MIKTLHTEEEVVEHLFKPGVVVEITLGNAIAIYQAGSRVPKEFYENHKYYFMDGADYDRLIYGRYASKTSTI